MTSRASATLIICAVAASATTVALFVPARTDQVTADTPDAYQAAVPADSAAPAGTPDVGVAAQPATITIQGFAFQTSGTFRPGETVTVNNLDGAPHTVTANDGSFDTGTIGGNATGQFTLPTTPGTFSFFCAIHPAMTGTITVAG
jgi:plastocyanin